MNTNIKTFIEENIELINSNQFEELYKKISSNYISELSDIFIKSGIDFLSFMKKIPENCFRNLNITNIIIPDSVTSIGDNAFSDCTSLKSITLPDSLTSISNWTFSDCTSLKSITIPEGVTSIGGGAFYGCSNLTSIRIPNSLKTIEICAFIHCTSLTKIIFNGTKNRWNSIEKKDSWDKHTGDYKIQCIDGEFNND